MSEHEVGVHVEPASETAFDLTRSDATAAILQRYSAGMGSVQTKALARVLASAVAAGANTVRVKSKPTLPPTKPYRKRWLPCTRMPWGNNNWWRTPTGYTSSP